MAGPRPGVQSLRPPIRALWRRLPAAGILFLLEPGRPYAAGAPYAVQMAVEPQGRTLPVAVTGSPISEEEVIPP